MKKLTFWTLLIPVAHLIAFAIIAEPCGAQSPTPTQQSKREATVAASPATAQPLDNRRKSSTLPAVRDHRAEDPNAGGNVRDHRTKYPPAAPRNHDSARVTTTLPAIREQQVTKRTVASQGAGKAFTLNLSRRGTIYAVAANVDRSQLRVRTAKGELTLADMIQRSGKNISGALRVGTTSDMRAERSTRQTASGRGGLNFDCGALACVCTGDPDCNDMFESGKCGAIAVCYPDGCICLNF